MDGHGRIVYRIASYLRERGALDGITIRVVDTDYETDLWHRIVMPDGTNIQGNIFDQFDGDGVPDNTLLYLNFSGLGPAEWENRPNTMRLIENTNRKENIVVSFANIRGAIEPRRLKNELSIEGYENITDRNDFVTYSYACKDNYLGTRVDQIIYLLQNDEDQEISEVHLTDKNGGIVNALINKLEENAIYDVELHVYNYEGDIGDFDYGYIYEGDDIFDYGEGVPSRACVYLDLEQFDDDVSDAAVTMANDMYTPHNIIYTFNTENNDISEDIEGRGFYRIGDDYNNCNLVTYIRDPYVPEDDGEGNSEYSEDEYSEEDGYSSGSSLGGSRLSIPLMTPTDNNNKNDKDQNVNDKYSIFGFNPFK